MQVEHMIIALAGFLFHCIFGPLVGLLIVLLREAVSGRPVPKPFALFGLIPLIGWPLAALWPRPRVPFDSYDYQDARWGAVKS